MTESTKRYTLLAASREHAQTVARTTAERDHPGENPDDLFDIHVSPLLPPDEVYTVDNEEMRRGEERWKSMMYAPPAGPLTAEAIVDQIVEEGRRMRQKVVDRWMDQLNVEASAFSQHSADLHHPELPRRSGIEPNLPTAFAGRATNLVSDLSAPDLTNWLIKHGGE